MDQTKISNESCVPAQQISSDGSNASDKNCVGVGVVSVLKFRYLSNSQTPRCISAGSTQLKGCKTLFLGQGMLHNNAVCCSVIYHVPDEIKGADRAIKRS